MTPKLSSLVLQRVAAVICGNMIGERSISPYRRGIDLDDFFRHDLGLDPSEVAGGSRASYTEGWLKKYNGTNDLRRIIEAAVRPSDYANTEYTAEEAVTYLNEVLANDNLRLARSGNGYRLRGPAGTEVITPKPSDVLSTGYVDELVEKCLRRLEAQDHEGAITNARTLLEAVLVAVEEGLTGVRGEDSGDLPKQFKRVARLLRMDDARPELDDRFKDVIRGLVMVVNGLAPIRNKMSDGHARVQRPAPHHARVVVNAAMTVTTFIIESYNVQVEKGLLIPKPASEPATSG